MQLSTRDQIRIRKMEFEDFDELEQLVHIAYRGGQAAVSWKNEHDIVSGPRITKDGLHALLSSNVALVLVAERDTGAQNLLDKRGNNLCGCVLIEKEGDDNQADFKLGDAQQEHAKQAEVSSLPAPVVVVIGMLAVGPAAQNLGLGRRLVTAAEEASIQNFNASVAHMHVASVRNELMQWYERLGYLPTGKVKPFPGPEVGIKALKKDLKFHVIEKKLF